MTANLPSQFLRRPRVLCWVLCMAVLFVLAPTLTRTLDFVRGSAPEGMVICTTQTPQTKLPAGEPAPESSQAPHAANPAHCPLCLHQADRLAPPPQAPALPLLLSDAQQALPEPPDLLYPAKHARWPAPRGPPGLLQR